VALDVAGVRHVSNDLRIVPPPKSLTVEAGAARDELRIVSGLNLGAELEVGHWAGHVPVAVRTLVTSNSRSFKSWLASHRRLSAARQPWHHRCAERGCYHSLQRLSEAVWGGVVAP
jgi:hypothetical protein